MRNKIILISMYIGAAFSANAQNYGFMGKKNSIGIQGVAYYNLFGLLGGSDDKIKLYTFPGIKYDRTISRRGMLSASFSQYNIEMFVGSGYPKSLYFDARLTLASNSGESYESVKYFNNYNNKIKMRNFLFGYHHFLLKRGGNAPLGLNIGCLWNLGVVDWSKKNAVSLYRFYPINSNGYGVISFTDVTMKRAYLSSLGLSIGNSNIYFKRIKMEYQLGMLFAFSNSITGKSSIRKSSVIGSNAADIMRIYDIRKVSAINSTFANYSISYLF